MFREEQIPQHNRYAGSAGTMLTAHAAHMTEEACRELWRRTLAAFERLQLS